MGVQDEGSSIQHEEFKIQNGRLVRIGGAKGSKIVHFRQLFGEGLRRPFSLDVQGKSGEMACRPGQEPQGGSSRLFLYLHRNTRTMMISESQISSTFVSPTSSLSPGEWGALCPWENCRKDSLTDEERGLIG
jgi:hypothetical protein